MMQSFVSGVGDVGVVFPSPLGVRGQSGIQLIAITTLSVYSVRDSSHPLIFSLRPTRFSRLCVIVGVLRADCCL